MADATIIIGQRSHKIFFFFSKTFYYPIYESDVAFDPFDHKLKKKTKYKSKELKKIMTEVLSFIMKLIYDRQC